ncbi:MULTISPECIES: winged helix-turn-helix transcriptional regulator [Phyllobacteriaceae]|jgi:DNA-binding HxlR family transcriptional regulator|uniref:HTH hxlR-type domain-containing protein n=1 Tax=Mesorhizobium hungaricum TaxID=1566387 RepID=A0A1C2DRY7_9HYPH|nr:MULTISPECIES: helix-turn-helix domain-containing protein [Mesorhizobium]MBN9236119.1 helix-turn-helix transcriptional regulator [Mesorhizobium sp.]MDQ0328081.1 DNA-binding HxlR family transcriptional regulator [Mesorhizobium sp. YL-MeA3-2017]OCX17527.1 hypothetical protein QV13_12255 [Mesorhizobium hungaricum]
MINSTSDRSEDEDRVVHELFADKWTILVLQAIYRAESALRFNVLKRQLVGITQKTLTQSLRRLERNGLISRRLVDTAPPGVEYSVTDLGRSVRTLLNAIHHWTHDNADQITRAQHLFDQKQPKPSNGAW